MKWSSWWRRRRRAGSSLGALGEAIFTEADDLPQLKAQVRDAFRCHFEEGREPKIIRLHFVREEIAV